MSIESLRIQGFRSLRDVTWKPGKLNVLIGPNGSGKSNLLRALELLRISAQGELSEAIISQGGMGALLWDSREGQISWSVNILSHVLQTPLTYEIEIRQIGSYSHFRVEHECLKTEDKVFFERFPGRISINDLDQIFTGDESSLKRRGGRVQEQESFLHSSAWRTPDPILFTLLLSDLRIYHDLRADQGAPLRQAAVARLEDHLNPDGQNLIPVLHALYTGNRGFKQDVDSAMRAAFGEDYEELVFPPAADQRVQLRIRWRSLLTEQSAANLSDGTLRFLMLLAILANPKPAPLIAIDEPETGLHPRMFPLIAEFATEAAEKTQVIFTTHSSQFLDAFKEEPPTTTVAQMVDGETRLSVLDGEELRRWLKEYSLGYLFRSRELEGMA